MGLQKESASMRYFMKKECEVLFHYTSLDTFVNIIKTKKLRLYDVTKSNDPLEGTYMIQALEEAYQRLYHEEKINKNEYMLAHRAFFHFQKDLIYQGRSKDFYGAASFCIPKHELLMLRSYADNGRGVAMGVPIKALKRLADANPQFTFRKIEYLSSKEINHRAIGFWLEKIKLRDIRVSCINEASLQPIVSKLKEYYHQSYFLKDKVNEDEEEYRLLFHYEDLFDLCLPGIGRNVPENIDFISTNGDLKAYCDIFVGDRDKAPLYFSNVIIGPQCEATASEVQTFLCRYGFKGCNVDKNSWIQMR